MWIFLKDAFLSIVQNKDNPDHLLVRARFKGDIERIFREAKVEEGKGTDYRFRASIPRGRVAAVMAAEVAVINYPNFKDRVMQAGDMVKVEVYHDVWATMADAQDSVKETT